MPDTSVDAIWLEGPKAVSPCVRTLMRIHIRTCNGYAQQVSPCVHRGVRTALEGRHTVLGLGREHGHIWERFIPTRHQRIMFQQLLVNAGPYVSQNGRILMIFVPRVVTRFVVSHEFKEDFEGAVIYFW